MGTGKKGIKGFCEEIKWETKEKGAIRVQLKFDYIRAYTGFKKETRIKG